MYKLKVDILGREKGQVNEVKILNKIVRVTDKGIELEADPRHVEMTIRDLKLEDAKISAVPGAKESKGGVSMDRTADQLNIDSILQAKKSGGG